MGLGAAGCPVSGRSGCPYPPAVEWCPSKPTLPQLVFGVVFFLGLAGLALYWAADETSAGNRVFLWCVAGLALVLALWRLVVAICLAREGSARHR